MTTAWTVLLIGVSTVFIGLILIIALIVIIRAMLSPRSKPAPHAEPQTANKSDNSAELIAVITASVAAMMNTSASTIRIASIQKADAPAWAFAERMSRKSKGTLLR